MMAEQQVKSELNPAGSVIVSNRRAVMARRIRDEGRWRSQDTRRWIDAARRGRRRRESAWLASQSVHQRRATEILSVFDVELRNVATSPLANFILHYVCCEALGKLLIGSRDNIPPHIIFQRKTLGGIEIDLRKLSPTVDRLGIPISPRGVGGDGSADERRGSCRGWKCCEIWISDD
jgi:hypothetical protein